MKLNRLPWICFMVGAILLATGNVSIQIIVGCCLFILGSIIGLMECK